MVRLGQLSPQARDHPARNVITRAVGSALRLLADVVLLDAKSVTVPAVYGWTHR